MEDLQLLVGPEYYKTLVENNISTNLNFFLSSTEELSKIINKTSEEINKLKLDLAKLIHKPNKIIKASDLVPWTRLSTGCRGLDCILGNGVPIGSIIEIFGCSGVGKTQFCLQLALQTQLSVDYGGVEKGVAYIYTEDIFPSKRLHQLSNYFKRKYNLFDKEFENSIFLMSVSDIKHFQKVLNVDLPLLLRRENIGLVVIDSIAGPFRGENENEYMKRSRYLVEIAHKLHNICWKYNVAIVCTNQVTDNIENNKTEPCLGVAWTNSINYRCEITRYPDSSREFRIVFSPDFTRRKCRFIITESGLESPE